MVIAARPLQRDQSLVKPFPRASPLNQASSALEPRLPAEVPHRTVLRHSAEVRTSTNHPPFDRSSALRASARLPFFHTIHARQFQPPNDHLQLPIRDCKQLYAVHPQSRPPNPTAERSIWRSAHDCISRRFGVAFQARSSARPLGEISRELPARRNPDSGSPSGAILTPQSEAFATSRTSFRVCASDSIRTRGSPPSAAVLLWYRGWCPSRPSPAAQNLHGWLR